jgi:hypothetical protein
MFKTSKIISIILIFNFILIFSSCGNKSSEEAEKNIESQGQDISANSDIQKLFEGNSTLSNYKCEIKITTTVEEESVIESTIWKLDTKTKIIADSTTTTGNSDIPISATISIDSEEKEATMYIENLNTAIIIPSENITAQQSPLFMAESVSAESLNKFQITGEENINGTECTVVEGDLTNSKENSLDSFNLEKATFRFYFDKTTNRIIKSEIISDDIIYLSMEMTNISPDIVKDTDVTLELPDDTKIIESESFDSISDY